MFNRNTLFIVGAGASEEAGLPVGSKLTDKIASLLNIHVDFQQFRSGDHKIYQALQRLANAGPPWDNNKFIASARAVSEAMDLALSIDTFLETHASNQEFVVLGKLGIVRAISIEERRSKLAPTGEGHKPFKMRSLSETWYYSLARQLFTGIPVEQPERAFENVAFVVFNYDRCLQVFLQRALEIYFRLPPALATEILRTVKIIHPYGSIGSIFEGSPGYVPYGSEEFDLKESAERIRTFSESAQSELVGQAQRMMREADNWVFLGFGFHEQNMRLLDSGDVVLYDGSAPYRYRAFATAYELSESDTQYVRDEISLLRVGEPEFTEGEKWISTVDGTCAKLFRTYWRSLTA